MKKKHIIYIIIFIVLLLLTLLLLWGFLAPHYDSPDCKFKFWGKYSNKNRCLQSTFSTSNRYFCAKVINDLDGNEYKICTPCFGHDSFDKPVKYIMNDDSTISFEICTDTNSYPELKSCVECNPINKGQTYPKDAKWKRQYPDFDPKSLPKICNNISDKNSCWRTAYYNEVKNYIHNTPMYYSERATPYWIKCNSKGPCCSTCKFGPNEKSEMNLNPTFISSILPPK